MLFGGNVLSSMFLGCFMFGHIKRPLVNMFVFYLSRLLNFLGKSKYMKRRTVSLVFCSF